MTHTEQTNYLTLSNRIVRGSVGVATIATVLAGVIGSPAGNFILATVSIYLTMTAIMGQEIRSLVRGVGGIAAIAAVVSGLIASPVAIFTLATVSVYLTITAILAQEEGSEGTAAGQQSVESNVVSWVMPAKQSADETRKDHKHAA